MANNVRFVTYEGDNRNEIAFKMRKRNFNNRVYGRAERMLSENTFVRIDAYLNNKLIFIIQK